MLGLDFGSVVPTGSVIVARAEFISEGILASVLSTLEPYILVPTGSVLCERSEYSIDLYGEATKFFPG